MTPGQLLDIAFRRKFGMPMPQGFDGPATPKTAAAESDADAPEGEPMPELDEDSPGAKAFATEALTDAQRIPPIGIQDVAVMLNGMLAAQRAMRGDDDALAVG